MSDKATQQNKEVKAFARYIHVSPRKLRLVADLVRTNSVDTALEQLRFSSKNAALPLTKVINSAVANAVHNFNLNRDNLYIKSLTIDGGPVYKTYAPRAQGRAFVERKRTSHINLILGSRDRAKSKIKRSIFTLRPKSTEPEVKKHDHAHEPATDDVDKKKLAPKQYVPKAEEKMKQQKISLKRRLFNRKSGE